MLENPPAIARQKPDGRLLWRAKVFRSIPRVNAGSPTARMEYPNPPLKVFGTSLEFYKRDFGTAMSLTPQEIFEFEGFALDPGERTLSRAGVMLPLTPKVFDTLAYMVRNPGRMLSKDELLKEIWPDTFVEEVNLAVNISTLRKILGEEPQDRRFIVTVPGSGYRFVATVSRKSNSSSTGPGAAILPSASQVSAGETSLHSQITPGPAMRRWRIGILSAVLAVLLVASIGYFLFLKRHGETQQTFVQTNSVAVLPFTDLSQSKDQEYFSDGLSEELIYEL